MSAFVISEVRFRDEQLARTYMSLAEASIERHGGRYIVRGAAPEVPEGNWDADRKVVIVEFDTMAALKSWYASSDYADALTVSRQALDRRVLFVDGV